MEYYRARIAEEWNQIRKFDNAEYVKEFFANGFTQQDMIELIEENMENIEEFEELLEEEEDSDSEE